MKKNAVKANGVSRITIAGNGLEAWLTANHLLAGLGSKQVKVTVCPVPGSDVLDELYSVWPIGPDDGLGTIGLSSEKLVRECRASYSLGARFSDLFRPYGPIGLDFLGLPFHHHWLRAHRGEATAGFFDWSPGTAAMKQGLFAPPVPQNAIGSLQHGMALHIDVGLLTSLLRDRALRNGAVQSGEFLSVVRHEGDDLRISGLDTESGQTLTADLYVDCSGPQKSLISGDQNATWQSAPGLEEYRIAVRKNAVQEIPPPYHQAATGPDGWKLDVYGSGWSMSLLVTCSETGGEGEFAAPGHLAEPWYGNCLAVGMAASTILPIEPVHTRYLAFSLKHLLELMPGADCAQRETIEYNNLAVTDLGEIHDLAAAYELSRKNHLGTASADIHDSLKRRLDLFASRGWVTPPDSGFFEPSDWVASFMQLGLVPGRPDRLADRIPIEALKTRLAQLRAKIDQTVSGFPPHADYLLAVKSSARSR